MNPTKARPSPRDALQRIGRPGEIAPDHRVTLEVLEDVEVEFDLERFPLEDLEEEDG